MAEEGTTATADDAAGSQEPPAETETDWKTEARKHENRVKTERKAREAAEAKLAKYAEANQTEHEKAIEKARKEAAQEAETATTGAFRAKILNAEIRAQAAGKFSNARLAPKLLDLDPETVFGEDGEPDAKAIAKAIDEFLAEDENAGLRAGGSSRPSGDADAGKGNGAPSGDMNEFIRSGIKRR
jgi:hypothetical protein